MTTRDLRLAPLNTLLLCADRVDVKVLYPFEGRVLQKNSSGLLLKFQRSGDAPSWVNPENGPIWIEMLEEPSKKV